MTLMVDSVDAVAADGVTQRQVRQAAGEGTEKGSLVDKPRVE